MSEQVIVAGTGPAGLTAALYLARADREPLVFEGDVPGGQLTTTTMVENYPGFDEGIMGPDLMDVMRKQAERFGARCKSGLVEKVDFSRRPFRIEVDGETYEAEALVIASGASPRLLGLESEKKLMGRGVSTCATCDGALFREKEVIVVGGGDSAMEESTFLAKFARKIYVAHRRDELRASKAMQKRAMDSDKIEFIWDTVVEDILDPEEGKVTGVKLRNKKEDKVSEKKIDGVFLAIGHDPNTQFLEGKLDMDKRGYIQCERDCSRTSVKGVFACGDVMDPKYRQVATSVGTGCWAGMDCDHFLSGEAS